MRAGIIYTSAHLHLKSLPVPTTGKIIVADADLLDISQLSAFNGLFHSKMMRCQKALVEYCKRYVFFGCKLNKITAFIIISREGLFNENVEAVGKQILGYGIVIVRISCVEPTITAPVEPALAKPSIFPSFK